MCGIAGGYWNRMKSGLEDGLRNAVSLLRHRGPNDSGIDYKYVASGVVALAHTRLSVIDLTSGGHQPMVTSDGRYSIVFNGEVYNYRELREELKSLGHTFHSSSDTEVLLYAWCQWKHACLARLEGMFAFVVHDTHLQTLTCVRDAFGIKPLFYRLQAESFTFASEQPALLALDTGKLKVDWQRSYDYLVHGDYDSQERTFIDGVRHLLPGSYIEVDLQTLTCAGPISWWKPKFKMSSALSVSQATEAVREQFLHNIRLHLRSDVAIGAALSGGIDSSAVVCAMRHVEPDLPINTFSYIAEGTELSEEKWVDRVNSFVGAKAHKVTATGKDLAADLDTMIRVQGEPFGSTSIYAQYKVFELARKNGVTVTLDGQGADELLAGYTGYPGHRLLSLLNDGSFFGMNSFAKNWGKWPGRSYKMAWMHLGRIILPEESYKVARKILGRDFKPNWLNTELLTAEGVNFRENRVGLSPEGKGRRVVENLAAVLQKRGLSELLRHGDRNSMRFAVESRVPFLTIPMADLLLSLPENYLISDEGETKKIFREAMRGIVPDDVLDRKDKVGFATPEKEWLLGMAPTIRQWLNDSEHIPFLNRLELIKEFELIAEGKKPFSWQVWRWVNFVRWYMQMGFDN
jgi:asparagine synthase (glutamine-hydrolysing)